MTENIKVVKNTSDIYYSYFKMLLSDSEVLHLTEFEYLILSFIARDENITSRQLAHLLATSRQSVTNYKKKLKDKKLLVKEGKKYIINSGILNHKLPDTQNYTLTINYN